MGTGLLFATRLVSGISFGYQAQSFDEAMEILSTLLPIIIPLSLIQLGLMIAAVIHVCKSKNFKIGNKVIWLLVVLLVNLIGPVLYFIIGRGDPAVEDEEGPRDEERR